MKACATEKNTFMQVLQGNDCHSQNADTVIEKGKGANQNRGNQTQ